ncbi:hypothetical protein ACO0QE_000270 [Hanseniaspora vineae]
MIGTLQQTAVKTGGHSLWARCFSSSAPAQFTKTIVSSNNSLASNVHVPNAAANVLNGGKPLDSRGGVQSATEGNQVQVEKNEVVKKFVLNGLFTSTNTIFTYSAVIEDLNYMKSVAANANANARAKGSSGVAAASGSEGVASADTGLSNYHQLMLYYLKLPHKVLFTYTTGQLGFKKKARGEYESGHQLTKKVFEKILSDKNLHNSKIPIEVVLKNFGKGRKAFLSCLSGKEGEYFKKYVTRISDDTDIKFGGTKSRKTRRV